MTLFSKVKNFFAGLFKRIFKKKEVKAIEVAAPVEIKSVNPVKIVLTPSVVEEPKVESPLVEQVKATRALSPNDLVELLKEAKQNIKDNCDHEHALVKQAWVRTTGQKYELHNEIICSKCKEKKTVPIE